MLRGLQGNKALISSLVSRASAGKLSGVYLLCGPKGVGKCTVAKALARLTQCVGTKEGSCTCRKCKQGLANDPDVMYVAPNQFNNILSGALEPVHRLLGEESSTGSKQRVLLVDGAECIHYSASDDLLKVLENVREGDLVLLVSSRDTDLNPTLLSRANVIRFSQLTKGEYLQALTGLGTKAQWSQDLARGARSLSLGLLTNLQVYKSASESAAKIFKGIKTLDLPKALKTMNEVSSNDEALALLEVLLLLIRDSMCSRAAAHTQVVFDSGSEEVSDFQEDYTLPLSDIVSDAIMSIQNGAPGRPVLAQAVNFCVAKVAATKQHRMREGNNHADI